MNAIYSGSPTVPSYLLRKSNGTEGGASGPRRRAQKPRRLPPRRSALLRPLAPGGVCPLGCLDPGLVHQVVEGTLQIIDLRAHVIDAPHDGVAQAVEAGLHVVHQ